MRFSVRIRTQHFSSKIKTLNLGKLKKKIIGAILQLKVYPHSTKPQLLLVLQNEKLSKVIFFQLATF